MANESWFSNVLSSVLARIVDSLGTQIDKAGPRDDEADEIGHLKRDNKNKAEEIINLKRTVESLIVDVRVSNEKANTSLLWFISACMCCFPRLGYIVYTVV